MSKVTWDFTKDVNRKLTVDHLAIHSDDLGTDGSQIVGDFHGTPIIGWDARDTAARTNEETRKRLSSARLYAAQHPEGGDNELSA